MISVMFYVFKQKTAYEMRISDGSSDVCSSDLVAHRPDVDLGAREERHRAGQVDGETALDAAEDDAGHPLVAVEGVLELRPGFLAPGLVAAQHGFAVAVLEALDIDLDRSEEHTSELQSIMRISYAVFCLKK